MIIQYNQQSKNEPISITQQQQQKSSLLSRSSVLVCSFHIQREFEFFKGLNITEVYFHTHVAISK